MSPESSSSNFSRLYILRKAWPIILANAAVPLLGLTDTAVIGRTGTVSELGAIALGALILSFVYWGFGFLRMGTSGFVAQAVGGNDESEVRAVLVRSLLLAIGFGMLLILVKWPLRVAALQLLDGSTEVEAITAAYIDIRLWGAPAALGMFALTGTLIGLGQSRTLLLVQLFMNGSNIILDIWFAGVLGWGAEGIALGTALAEWSSFVLTLWLMLRVLKQRQRAVRVASNLKAVEEKFFLWQRIFESQKLRQMMSANTDIMIRTLLLVFGFAWFTNRGAQFGDSILAANHVLLQLVSFSAFFLDGYAFVVEAMVGSALGARQLARFDLAVRLSSQLAAVTALMLAAIILFAGPQFIRALTDLESVRTAALHALPLAALYVLCAFPAFQLDGIFIGTTRTRAMRNASALSLLIFLLLCVPMTYWWGNTGLWWSFVLYALARALSLGLYYPGLRRCGWPSA